MNETFANPEVLDFYRSMPFNVVDSADAMAAAIRGTNAVLAYPPLTDLLRSNTRVLDAGCGTGWFTNTIAYHYDCDTVGIDFNPVAVEFGRRTAAALGVKAAFDVADLFRYNPGALFDVVVSIGVLHHTNSCEAGFRRLLRDFVRPGGHALVGLYHWFGRRPFLDFFARMKAGGASEPQLYEEFRALFGSQTIDETHCRSWFRDQVLHPHETQHSLRDLLPMIEDCDAELVGTSLNQFESVRNWTPVLDAEASWEAVGTTRLAENRYFPGFFAVLVRRRQPDMEDGPRSPRA